ncbi:hypothetical protein TNCV_2831401 [Trichonephila clavipes]|nr:hypothetical protein TNCV_2831401 [Trichonephila clavipes]
MGVQKLDWPSQSPDINRIEHLWGELERRLRSQPNLPSSLQALTSAVMDAWKATPMDGLSPYHWVSGYFWPDSVLSITFVKPKDDARLKKIDKCSHCYRFCVRTCTLIVFLY